MSAEYIAEMLADPKHSLKVSGNKAARNIRGTCSCGEPFTATYTFAQREKVMADHAQHVRWIMQLREEAA